jgi:hypothetical protein
MNSSHMHQALSLLDFVFAIVSVIIALVYAPLSRTWLRAILATLVSSIVSAALGLFLIATIPDSGKSVLACVLYPLSMIVVACVARAVKLVVSSICFSKRQP